MVTVKLPDGKVVEYPDGATAADVIAGIGPGLARKAVAATINGDVVDLNRALPSDGLLEFRALTADDPDGLYVMRHSAAHVMAEAICTLWPDTKLVYGPPVENGFYYDIDLKHSLTPEDFPKIEAKMADIVKEDRPFTRYEMSRGAGMQKLHAEGNVYKVDNAERADGDVLSFYVTGASDSGCFEDLCRGPHVPSTSRIGAYKVMQVAGAYWHGDASKPMLQRVYGTAWPDKKALAAHLNQLEEARKRDHRKIGQQLGLFTLDPDVGTGLILWKPRGAMLRYTLESFIRDELLKRGYQPVYTPHIGKLDLYRCSGHYPYYRDSQFPPMQMIRDGALPLITALEDAEREERSLPRDREEELVRAAGIDPQKYPWDEASPHKRLVLARDLATTGEGYLLKPMNCPHHIKIFDSDARSYRDLPVRLAEFGTVYRYEQSGEVCGMTRVRGFTQDDAHIFCTQEQLAAEVADCVDLAKLVLGVVGLNDYRVRVGLRDPESDKYVGSAENWNRAEDAVRQAVKASGMQSSEEKGEAAFYGPKIDFVVKDCIGREWQLGTVQVDYNLPERFKLRYIGEDNAEHRPVMVHRAPFGSMERFVGILIEHFAGAFPLWLAPVQATICPVSDKSAAYASQVHTLLRDAGLRVELDESSDRVGAKIRRATLMKVPYIVVIGEQEAAERKVNIRTRDGQQLGSCTVPEFLAACAKEISERGGQRPCEVSQASR